MSENLPTINQEEYGSGFEDAPSSVYEGRYIPDNLHDVCRQCIKTCREKYNGFVGADGTYYKDGFSVKCGYVPDDEVFLNPKIKSLVSDEDFEEMNSMQSALPWATRNLINPDTGLPWRPRSYQIPPLLCTSPKVVMRYGRRTGKSVTLAVLMAWYLFTGGNLKDPETGKRLKKINILVVAPLKSHVDELLTRLRSLIYAVPKLAACVKRDTKGSPQEIELNGEDGAPGSKIKGYASGDASGSKGTGIRGNDAHLIIVDEAAFVSDTVMKEAIRPILMTTPSTKMIWSSTPSGIAGDHFEEVCLNMPDYKEFYVSSTKMPNFDLMRDAMVKEYGNSPDEWEREVEANFPEGGIGVYKKALVRTAQKDYHYDDMTPTPGMAYTIGVDWNKEKGTEIYVVGTQKASPFISQVVLGLQIPKKDFDTPMGIHKIIELNRIWEPATIYVDEGGDGSTCCQMLQFIGKEQAGKNIKDARLMYIVKAYDFGSKIKFRDFQGKEVKKPAKVFLVENSVRRFELGELYLSRHDIDLQKQLDNYVVKRRTEAGLPVYGTEKDKIGDHKVDALNLALVAIRLELPSLNSREVVTFDGTVRYANNSMNKTAAMVNNSLSHGVKPRALNHERAEVVEDVPYRVVKVNGTGMTKNSLKSRGRGLKYRGGRTWR